jgi:hypothetical protein
MELQEEKFFTLESKQITS